MSVAGTIAVILFGVGLGMLLVAVRGVRRGVAPHCRTCGYNRSGIDPTSACPECGAERGHVRKGERRRRPILGSIGAGLVVIAFVPFVGPGRTWWSNFDAYSVLPDWYLQHRLESGGDVHAAATLAQRWIDGKLTDEDALVMFRTMCRYEGRTRPHNSTTSHVPYTIVFDPHAPTASDPEYGIGSTGFGRFSALNQIQNRRVTYSNGYRAGMSKSNGVPGGVGYLAWAPTGERQEEPIEFGVEVETTLTTPDGVRSVTWRQDVSVTSEIAPEGDVWPGLRRLDDDATTNRIADAILSASKTSVPLPPVADPAIDSSGGGFIGWQSNSGEQYEIPEVKLPPVGVWASIEVRQSDRRYSLGPMHWSPEIAAANVTIPIDFDRTLMMGRSIFPGRRESERRDRTRRSTRTWRDELLGEAELIIRSDLDEAWHRPVIDAVWDGELRFRIRVSEKGVEILERLPVAPLADETPPGR